MKLLRWLVVDTIRDLLRTSWDEWETFAWRVFILFAYWLMLLGLLTAR